MLFENNTEPTKKEQNKTKNVQFSPSLNFTAVLVVCLLRRLSEIERLSWDTFVIDAKQSVKKKTTKKQNSHNFKRTGNNFNLSWFSTSVPSRYAAVQQTFWFILVGLGGCSSFSVSKEAEWGTRSVQDKRTKGAFKTIEEKKEGKSKEKKKHKLSVSSSESSHSSTHKTHFQPDQHILKAHCIVFSLCLIVRKDILVQCEP